MTARFIETKSTCGAATCTITSVKGVEGGDWSEDCRSETLRILCRKAAELRLSLKCRVCDKGTTEITFSSSQIAKFFTGDAIVCDSCNPVDMYYVKEAHFTLVLFDTIQFCLTIYVVLLSACVRKLSQILLSIGIPEANNIVAQLQA